MTTRRTSGRRGSRRRNPRNNRRWLAVGLIAVPTVAIACGGLFLNEYMKIEQINDVSYCYDKQYQEQSAFFIDYSFIPQTSPQQERDLKNAILRAYDALPPNGRLSIFTTAKAEAGNIASPVYSQCRPANTVEEQGQIPAQNKTSMELSRGANESRQLMLAEIDRLVSEMRNADVVARNSPMLEQVQAITRYYDGSLNTLSFYSDGIQNSPLRQFCVTKGHLPSASMFLESRDYRYVQPEPMMGVEVNVLLVETGRLPTAQMPYCTNNELRDFWPAYFEAHGAIARLERL